MSKLDKEQVIAKFTKAFQEANGKEPQIEAKGGWYSVDGDKNIRLAQLDEMAEQLTNGDASKTESAATEAAPKKEPAPKAKTPKTSKKHSKFTVKGYWIEQLDADKPGSTAPR